MRITICGSVAFINEMNQAKAQLEKGGHTVYVPVSAERNQTKDFWEKMKAADIRQFISIKTGRMRGHFDIIKSSDAILVLNYDKDGKKNYIGPNTLMEMAVAFEHGKKIFILNPLPDFAGEELMAMSPVCLNGDPAGLS